MVFMWAIKYKLFILFHTIHFRLSGMKIWLQKLKFAWENLHMQALMSENQTIIIIIECCFLNEKGCCLVGDSQG